MIGTQVNFVTAKNIAKARAALETEGVWLIPDACTRDYCEDVKAWIDQNEAPSRRESFYAGTELRIWDDEEHHAILEPFRQASDEFLTAMLGEPAKAYSVLAIRNLQIPPEDAAVRKGRWHIDSFRRQLKIFIFLTDTTMESGPFEFIPGTHAGRFKATMALRGFYFKPKDFVSGSRSYTSLPEDLPEQLAERGLHSQKVLVKAGTAMIVDTSAIHRASPCLEGSRYAIVTYYH